MLAFVVRVVLKYGEFLVCVVMVILVSKISGTVVTNASDCAGTASNTGRRSRCCWRGRLHTGGRFYGTRWRRGFAGGCVGWTFDWGVDVFYAAGWFQRRIYDAGSVTVSACGNKNSRHQYHARIKEWLAWNNLHINAPGFVGSLIVGSWITIFITI